ncbi:15945_t:CDS:2, partial [Gigaspora margarita]
MTSFAPVECKQTISGHALSLISIPTLPTMASQQTESIMNPGQLQSLTSQIGQFLAPNDKVPSPDTKAPMLVPELITINSEETSKGIEIDPNLDTASVTSTIESDSLSKTYSQVVSTPNQVDPNLIISNITPATNIPNFTNTSYINA